MHHTRTRWLVVPLAISLLLAACGDDGGDDTTDTTAAASAAEDGTSPERTDETIEPQDTTDTTAEASATSAVEEGSAPDRTGETIKVGYVNNEGGAVSLPEFRVGGEVAIGLINEQGGVNGATIEIVPCNSDGSPEGSINCANTLIEADVVMVYAGIDLGSDAALPLYVDAGIPYVSSNGWGPQQSKDPGSFILHAAGAAFAATPLSVLKDLGATTVAVIVEDSPAATAQLANVVTPVAEKLGVELETITVDPAAPDYATAVAAAQAADADAIWGQLTEPGCIGMVQATSASGFDGPVFAGSCSFYISVLGDASVGTYSQADIYRPDAIASAPPEIQARLDEYIKAMTAADAADKAQGFAAGPYSAWFEILPILESIDGEITGSSIIDAFQNAGTTPGWLGPDLHCGGEPWPPQPSHCSAEVAVFQVEKADDGSLSRTKVVDFQNPYELTQ